MDWYDEKIFGGKQKYLKKGFTGDGALLGVGNYRAFFNRIIERHDFDIDIDEVHKNAWTVFVNARIDDDAGNLLGVCGVGVDFTDVQNFFITAEQAYNIKINLVDENGLVQVDTASVNIENPRVENVINPEKST